MFIWLMVLLVSGWIAPAKAQDWDAADRATNRLAPSVFVNLPAAIRAELERRGCTIPQPFGTTSPANVVKGRFTSPGRIDWAVLCSRDRTSSILVFRAGSATAVVDLASEPDQGSLQGVGNGAIGYSRALGVADPTYIKEHYARYGGPKPPPLDHDGINDIIVGKGSLVWYWYGGRWLKLTGAD
jgi:hypothetical protein